PLTLPSPPMGEREIGSLSPQGRGQGEGWFHSRCAENETAAICGGEGRRWNAHPPPRRRARGAHHRGRGAVARIGRVVDGSTLRPGRVGRGARRRHPLPARTRQPRLAPRSRLRLMFVELHAKSAFSFLEAAVLPEALAERAAALGQPALALVDADGVYGAPRFYGACT